jgi:pimeloyl-ACP methyl ester carboxylesterase
VAPVAEQLADKFQVLEPWQRASGAEPLTVACHIADLHDVIVSRCGDEKPAIVGSSWGAMLALAYAAEHPDRAGPLVLIGCGTFDLKARSKLQSTIASRIDAGLKEKLDSLQTAIADPDLRLKTMAELMSPVYSYDPLPDDHSVAAVDARAMEETWDDMLRLQAEGVYPKVFSTISSPVLMLHGAYDPHPGRMILASLKPYLPQIEYREWKRCGHYPWRERGVREQFFKVLREWLASHTSA